MKKQVLTILFMAIVIVGCSDKQSDLIEFKQKESNYSASIERTGHQEEVYAIDLYFYFEVKKNTVFRSVNLSGTNSYLRKNTLWDGAFDAYTNENGEMKFVIDGELNYFSPNEIIYKAIFLIDPNSPYYPLIAEDVERLKMSKQDTVHIGTIQELKQTNAILINEFLKIDSVKFDYLYQGGFHHLILPIEMK